MVGRAVDQKDRVNNELATSAQTLAAQGLDSLSKLQDEVERMKVYDAELSKQLAYLKTEF